MALHKLIPPLSSRMAMIKVLASIEDAIVIEFGCMGHNLYAKTFLSKEGISDASNIFSTHLDEKDISFGSTKRIDNILPLLIEEYKPKAIFFLPSAIPLVIGSDIDAYIEENKDLYPETKLVYFDKGSFNYNAYDGVEEVLYKLVKEFSINQDINEVTYNIIGSGADLYKYNEDTIEIQRIIKNSLDLEVNCIYSSNCSIEDIENLNKATFNLVIREEGLKAAQYLEKNYGMPYLYIRAYGKNQTTQMIKDIALLTNIEINTDFILQEEAKFNDAYTRAMRMFMYYNNVFQDQAQICIGGHGDIVDGLSRYISEELKLPLGICWKEFKQCSSDYPYLSKEEALDKLKGSQASIIFADYQILELLNKDTNLSLTRKPKAWHINNYKSPMVGYRGAINIIDLILNALQQTL